MNYWFAVEDAKSKHSKPTAMNYNFNIIKGRTWSKGVPSNVEMPQPVHKSVLGSTSHRPLCLQLKR